MSNTNNNDFINNLNKMKHTIREEVKHGLMGSSSTIDREEVIKVLNHSLATEIICVHRYKKHYYAAASMGEHVISNEFLEHANEEQEHADKLAKRIAQLGGEPEYDLTVIKNTAHTEYKTCDTVEEMLTENLIAERIAVFIYQEIIKLLDNKDPVTRRILEEILAVEEEHVDDMYDFLNKKSYITNRRIEELKEKATELAMKMIAEEENMGNPITTSEPDISEIVEELNKLDKEKEHQVADFIPKK